MVRELSDRRNGRSEKCLSEEMSVGKVSVGDLFQGKCQSGRCPAGELSAYPSDQLGNCPVGELSAYLSTRFQKLFFLLKEIIIQKFIKESNETKIVKIDPFGKSLVMPCQLLKEVFILVFLQQIFNYCNIKGNSSPQTL